MGNLFDEYGMFDEDADIERREPQCNRCGSHDVRWRQQGGRWVLFSLAAGVVHACLVTTDGFEVVPE